MDLTANGYDLTIAVSVDVSFYGSEQLYGIPEHASSLVLKQTTFVMCYEWEKSHSV